jgi:transcriptional regulator with XRE-family HTH domain
MKTRGIRGPSELARRLSKSLGRTVNRQTVYKWMNGDVASIRADVMLAVAAELDYSVIWLSTGQGDPQTWTSMDDKKRELGNVYGELTEAAKDELLSYAYRLLRVASKPSLIDPHPAVPAKIKHK